MEGRAHCETFCQRVVAAASIRPDKVAMTVSEADGEETVTFGSMLAQLRSIAYRLTKEGIDFGDRVALIGENHPNWAIAYLGTIYRGAADVIEPVFAESATATLHEGDSIAYEQTCAKTMANAGDEPLVLFLSLVADDGQPLFSFDAPPPSRNPSLQ